MEENGNHGGIGQNIHDTIIFCIFNLLEKDNRHIISGHYAV